eukprot:TRINITY_DN1277_c0_g1_i1.p2 TRINITY_DN1277_c0_g1~~TRINITY_DN1277_c0_g1_i1.p2  ORF type:complete len:299 (+),score=45.44 TRINITY_DN1277_c0_g1_i1:33-899(+)
MDESDLASERSFSFLGLEEKHVLLTGASGGIGITTAALFLQHGAKVSMMCNTSREALEGLVLAYPHRAVIVSADVKDEQQVTTMFYKATSTFGPIDVLVLSHGVFPAKDTPITDMSVSQFKETIDVNLVGCFVFARQFLRHLKSNQRQTGNIVLVGSTSGLYGEAGHVDYSCSKSALMYGFMRTLKNEIVQIAPQGRVNSVAPGWVVTQMAKDAMKDEQVVTRVLQTIPMRKVARTDDVASSILYLSSDKAAGHVSGTVLEVTGGMEGRLLFEKHQVASFASDITSSI